MLANQLASCMVRELVCDLLATWSQTNCEPDCDQVRAISACRDSSNLVADRFEPGHGQVRSWSATSSQTY